MRNIVFVGFMSILYACSPSSHSTEYSVSGVVSDSAANGKKIYILRYDDNQYIDSTVIEKNQFTFKGQVDTASYSALMLTEVCMLILFWKMGIFGWICKNITSHQVLC